LAATTDEHTQIVASDVHQKRANPPVFIHLSPFCLDPTADSHPLQQLDHRVVGDANHVGIVIARFLGRWCLGRYFCGSNLYRLPIGRRTNSEADSHLTVSQAQKSTASFVQNLDVERIGRKTEFACPTGYRLIDARSDDFKAGFHL